MPILLLITLLFLLPLLLFLGTSPPLPPLQRKKKKKKSLLTFPPHFPRLSNNTQSTSPSPLAWEPPSATPDSDPCSDRTSATSTCAPLAALVHGRGLSWRG
ncbi:hypothetical protein BGX38DRAFT_120025 [Terfezia claveryi]|nr:hypothetical protein BGX38DRAFT_120025 [Terfezia claveryi]